MTGATRYSIVLDDSGLARLISHLKKTHGQVLGPQVRDGAVVLDEIDNIDDLPRGVAEEQVPGRYRLSKSGDNRHFAHTVGPHSWKKYLHPSRQPLWRSVKEGEKAAIVAEPLDDSPRAFLGVKPCELAAIEIQDKVFTGGRYKDPHYAARRAHSFIVVANCSRAAQTCFCTSMKSGPRAEAGFDLALTELGDGRIVVESGSAAGEATLKAIGGTAASAGDIAAAKAVSKATAQQITRHLDTKGLPEALKGNPNAKRWDDVAARCLNCANCTMVCPTCFCISVEDTSDLEGKETARSARWDSCFTADHSYIHGGAVRPSSKSQYRQWLTHKFATWHDQFDMPGCTGCGRCITWCPVGIDVTQEAAAIRSEIQNKV